MDQTGYIVHKILGPVTKINPFLLDFETPTEGNHIFIFEVLSMAFVDLGIFFAGCLEQFVQAGVEEGFSENEIRDGFAKLSHYGYIEISDDVFTPTDKFLAQGWVRQKHH